MALNMKNLTAPGDIDAVDGAKIAASVGGRGGSMPTWGVGDPVATAVAGFQKGMEKFKEHYDRTKADEFLINKKMELDKLYFDKENGLFNTRKGEAAQGLYQEGVEYMSNMWNKDAQDNLSDKQRLLVSQGMNQLFNDYSHKIAKYETDEMINGTKNRIETNIFNCQNMVATGDFTNEDLGLALHGIRNGVESLGKLQGLDDETIKMNQEKEIGTMLTKAATGLAATRPEAAINMLKAYKGMIPAMMYEPCMKTLTKRADAEVKRREGVQFASEVNALCEGASSEDDAGSVWTLIQKKYPNNPKKQKAAFNYWKQTVKNGLVENKIMNDIAVANFKKEMIPQLMNMPWREREAKFRELKANITDPELQERVQKAYDSYRRYGDVNNEKVTFDDSGATAELLSRAKNGEVFDPVEEYGSVVTKKTLDEVTKDIKSGVLDTCKTEFEDTMREFIGVNGVEGEILAKDILGTNKIDKMFDAFYKTLSAKDKENPKLIQDKTRRYIQSVVIDDGSIFSSEKSMPRGFAQRTLNTNPKASIAKGGGVERKAVTTMLDKKGKKKKGAFGGTSYDDSDLNALSKTINKDILEGKYSPDDLEEITKSLEDININ